MTNEAVISIPKPSIINVVVHITGTAPLICHAWSDKARKQMLDKQMKKATKAKEAKDPQRDYEESLYPLNGPGSGYGFPSSGFKKAAVRAGTYSDIAMTFLRGAFHVSGELVPLDGEPEMREDMVRLNGTTSDIRYRGEFKEWSAAVPVELNSSVLSIEQLVNLFTIAGFAVGVGEWRPEKNGQYGRFMVDTVEVV